MLDWCKTPLGAKITSDLARLYSRHLPNLNSLGYRISTIRKELKAGKFPEFDIANVNTVRNDKVNLLFEAIELKQYLEAVKVSAVLDENQPDVAMISAFDQMTIDYIGDLRDYFRANYSDEELKELLGFYQTTFGIKITGNATKLIRISIDSQHEWARGVKRIFGYINMGKFQHEHFKEQNKQ